MALYFNNYSNFNNSFYELNHNLIQFTYSPWDIINAKRVITLSNLLSNIYFHSITLRLLTVITEL